MAHGRRRERTGSKSFSTIDGHIINNGAHEDGEFSPNYVPKFTTPEEFINARIKILQKHMKIDLTYEDIAQLREYRTEGEINAAVKGILNKYWK